MLYSDTGNNKQNSMTTATDALAALGDAALRDAALSDAPRGSGRPKRSRKERKIFSPSDAESQQQLASKKRKKEADAESDDESEDDESEDEEEDEFEDEEEDEEELASDSSSDDDDDDETSRALNMAKSRSCSDDRLRKLRPRHLQTLKSKMLQQHCVDRGLSKQNNKTTLTERLWEYLTKNQKTKKKKKKKKKRKETRKTRKENEIK